MKPGAEESQLSDLRALGLDLDGEGACQSERIEPYEASLIRLHAADPIYPCYCTRADARAAASAPHGDPGTCQLPGELTTWNPGSEAPGA